jgi:hypothetical protein
VAYECKQEALVSRIVRLETSLKALRKEIQLQLDSAEKALLLKAAQDVQRRIVVLGFVMVLLSFVSSVVGGVIVRWATGAP